MDPITEFFIQPLLQGEGYNMVNTLVYGLILLGVAFYGIFPFFDKKGVKFDFHFLASVFPFILFGSSLRIIEDLKIFSRSANPLEPAFYTLSPGIYIFVGIVTILALFLALNLAKKINRPALMVFGAIGWLFALPTLGFVLLHTKEIIGPLMILTALAVSFGIGYFLFHKNQLKDRLAKGAFLGQLTDGAATFIAIGYYNYGEQHVVPNLLMNTFGPIAFLIAKFAISLLIIWAANKYMNEKDEHNLKGFVFVFIAIIGFAPGLRDLLRLAALT